MLTEVQRKVLQILSESSEPVSVPKVAEKLWDKKEDRTGGWSGAGRGRSGAVSRILNDLFRVGMVQKVAGYHSLTERGRKALRGSTDRGSTDRGSTDRGSDGA